MLLAFVLLLTKAIQAWLGHTGIYLLAGISGVADVDAITISLARLAGTDLSIQVSSVAVVLATMVNTITKTILAMIIGGRTMGLLVAWPLNDRFGGWRHGVVASSILIVIVHRNSRTASPDAYFAPP